MDFNSKATHKIPIESCYRFPKSRLKLNTFCFACYFISNIFHIWAKDASCWLSNNALTYKNGITTTETTGFRGSWSDRKLFVFLLWMSVCMRLCMCSRWLTQMCGRIVYTVRRWHCYCVNCACVILLLCRYLSNRAKTAVEQKPSLAHSHIGMLIPVTHGIIKRGPPMWVCALCKVKIYTNHTHIIPLVSSQMWFMFASKYTSSLQRLQLIIVCLCGLFQTNIFKPYLSANYTDVMCMKFAFSPSTSATVAMLQMVLYNDFQYNFFIVVIFYHSETIDRQLLLIIVFKINQYYH